MKRKGGPQGDLNGFLDRGSHLQGELTFEDTFRVDGRLSGSVQSGGDLYVGEGGVVEGEVKVGRLFVSGTLQGSVVAGQRIEIAAGARVEGELVTPALVIHEGAFFQGQSRMVEPREEVRNLASLPVAKGR